MSWATALSEVGRRFRLLVFGRASARAAGFRAAPVRVARASGVSAASRRRAFRRRRIQPLGRRKIRQFGRLQVFGQVAGRIDRLPELVVEVDLPDLFQLLADVVELGLADHLIDAALEFARQGARLAYPETGDAQRLRQVLRPDEDERHDPDQHQFRPAEIKEHRIAFRRAGNTWPKLREGRDDVRMGRSRQSRPRRGAFGDAFQVQPATVRWLRKVNGSATLRIGSRLPPVPRTMIVP